MSIAENTQAPVKQVAVPLLDLKAQYAAIKTELLAAVEKVLESQHFILGPAVAECERRVAAYSQCDHAVGVSSGSDALLACLMAEGVGPGDEVITTPYTFFATVGCISRVGARPVFVDIQPDTYNIDVAQIEGAVTARTKAIIPVHLFGQCAEMDPLLEIARDHEVLVIEDAAQAIGAEYYERRAGAMGDYGCFSFFPSKNLGAAGDGGMIVTDDAARAEKLRILRAHGSKPKYFHSLIGGNFRLDALQAAIVNVKLNYLDRWTAARQANAEHYRRLLDDSRLVDDGLVTPPAVAAVSRHIYNQFVIRAARRDELQTFLHSRQVNTEVYYPLPMHLQECFADLGYRAGDFPHCEAAAHETLAFPIYPELQLDQIEWVVHSLREFYDVC